MSRLHFHEAAVLLACLLPASQGISQQTVLELPRRAPEETSSKVTVEFYTESLCPDCRRFTNKTLAPLFENGIAKHIDLQLIPYGNAHVQEDGNIVCQHGVAECEFNKIFGCIVHEYPDQAAWFPVIACIERASPLIMKHAFHQCVAAAYPAMEEQRIEECVEGGLGYELQLSFGKRTDALSPPHTEVPWVTVNGASLHGDDLDKKLKKYICNAIADKHSPQACIDDDPGLRVL